MFLQPTHISKEGIHICAHLLSSLRKNDAHTYLSVRDAVFRKHEKIAVLKTASATGIPQKYLIFASIIIFSKTNLLLILALQYVTHVEAKAILGRPATNLGTRCITFIPSSIGMFYFWAISVCTTTSRVGTTGQNCVNQTHRYCVKTEIIKGFTNNMIIAS